MIESTSSQILDIAESCASTKESWHFHIMSPECLLNNTGKYALILENITNKQTYQCLSDRPYMDIGKTLVQFLHGNDVIKKEAEPKLSPPSPNVSKILEQAKRANSEGKFWHHHMLFPDCAYNKNQGQWAIVFEDQDNQEVITSLSENEPKNDLQYIENLFYQQKK